MTNEEAVKLLTNAEFSRECQSDEYLEEAKCMAIEALEKQIQKKPFVSIHDATEYNCKVNRDVDISKTTITKYKCPNCHKETYSAFWFCVFCGQNLDWSDHK